MVTKDIGDYVYATTIGFAQFREHVVNRKDTRSSTSELIHSNAGGCIGKIYTGKAGRPRKKGMTRAEVKRMKARTGRKVASPALLKVTPTLFEAAACQDSEDDGSEGETAVPSNISPKRLNTLEKNAFQPRPRKALEIRNSAEQENVNWTERFGPLHIPVIDPTTLEDQPRPAEPKRGFRPRSFRPKNAEARAETEPTVTLSKNSTNSHRTRATQTAQIIGESTPAIANMPTTAKRYRPDQESSNAALLNKNKRQRTRDVISSRRRRKAEEFHDRFTYKLGPAFWSFYV